LALASAAATAQAGPHALPFKATVAFSESVIFTYQPPCLATGSLTGSGHARYLGTLQASAQNCINPIGVFDPNAPSFWFVSSGPGLVFTAASGDQLFGHYSGTLTYRRGLPHRASGYFVLNGGTGRFMGATGGGVLSGEEDIGNLSTGTGRIRFDGEVVLQCDDAAHCDTGAP